MNCLPSALANVVRDHRPLQQGLRPIEVFEKDLQEVRVRDHLPIQ